MSDQFIDQIAEDAMKALRGDDPVVAAKALSAMLKENPERIDLIHALAVTELRMGEADSAYALTLEGERIANIRQDAVAGPVMPQLMLVRAAARGPVRPGRCRGCLPLAPREGGVQSSGAQRPRPPLPGMGSAG